MFETCGMGRYCLRAEVCANRATHSARWRVGRHRCPIVCTSGTPVRVSFGLPYRCNFGQNLRLVGSGAPLGDWDVSRSAAMTWSAGDVWKAELELELGGDAAIEYKYVVVGEDGWCSSWKPGDNISLLLPEVDKSISSLQSPKIRCVRVMDSWDGSSRGIEYEVEEGGQLADALSEAGLSANAEGSAVFLAMRNAIAELDEKMTRTLSIVERLEDPGAKEAVVGDREVAAAARKALSLAKAVEMSRDAKALEVSRGAGGCT